MRLGGPVDADSVRANALERGRRHPEQGAKGPGEMRGVVETNGLPNIGHRVRPLPQQEARAADSVAREILAEGNAELSLESAAERATAHPRAGGDDALPQLV